MDNKQMKRRPILLAKMEMQIKTIKYHIIPTSSKMGIIKKANNMCC